MFDEGNFFLSNDRQQWKSMLHDIFTICKMPKEFANSELTDCSEFFVQSLEFKKNIELAFV